MTFRKPNAPGKKRSALPRLALLCGALLVALAAAEILTRLFFDVPAIERIRPQDLESAYRFSENPILGYVLKESYRNPDPDYHETFAFTNRHGQRDIERTVAKPPGTKRVIVLGDSVVAGNGIESMADTIPGQLERIYRENGHDVEVLNFGVSGYCTRAEVELFRTRALKFDPDKVVVVWVANDTDEFNAQLMDGRYRKSRPAFLNELFVRSHLMRRLCLAYDLFHFRQETDPQYDVDRNFQAEGLVSNITIGFNELSGLARLHGFEPFVAIWPMFSSAGPYDAGSADFHTLPDGTLLVAKHAAEAGLPVERLLPWFRRDLDQRGKRIDAYEFYTIGDGMHPSAAGAAVGARALFDLLGDPSEWEAGSPPAGPLPAEP